MKSQFVRSALLLALLWPVDAFAQPVQDRWPDQTMPQQQWPTQPRPPQTRPQQTPPQQTPPDDPISTRRPRAQTPRPQAQTPRPQSAAKPAKPAGPEAPSIKCEGPFARDSNHDRLVEAFGRENVVHTEVEASDGSRVMASVIFPSDPKQRIEVLWHDDPNRSRPQSIVIEGASAWAGPRNLKLGAGLPDVERLNGKPFKLSGLEGRGASALDWQGGALSKISGGCLLGILFSPDSKAPDSARRNVTANNSGGKAQFSSADAPMRAIKPRTAQIILGYAP